MPGGSKGLGVRGLEDKAARILAAVNSKPTVDQVGPALSKGCSSLSRMSGFFVFKHCLAT
jgi:hypothetical protein